MATQDRTGNAAFPERIGQLKDGANHFLLLMERVREISDTTCTRFGDHIDGRDYRLICSELENTFRVFLHEGSGNLKEGFVRAFCDFMTLHVDGFTPPDNWDPLSSTASAFAREGEGA